MTDAECRKPDAITYVGTHMVTAELSAGTRRRAFDVCGRCTVRTDCLQWAIGEPDMLGILGGTDSAYRRQLRRATHTVSE
jgi:Transcription factor WhiB